MPETSSPRAIAYSDVQLQFLLSTLPELAFVGGIRSGKTWAGCSWVLAMLARYPGCTGLVCANTYPQLRDSTLPTMLAVLGAWGWKYRYHRTDKELHVYGRRILFRSLDAYDTIRGQEHGYALIDEASYSSLDALQVVRGRLSSPNGPCRLRITTTARGRGWLYDQFVTELQEHPELRSRRGLISGVTTQQNRFLSKAYLDLVASGYSGDYARQELGGEFVSFSGRVFPFHDDHLVPVKFDPVLPYWHTVDFGRRRPAWLVIQPYGEGDVIVDAYLREDVLTEEMASEMKRRYPDPVFIACDPAGDASNSHTYESDVGTLKKLFRRPVKFTHDPRLRAIESSVAMVASRVAQGKLYVSRDLSRKRPGEYVSVWGALTGYSYPEGAPGECRPVKDGLTDHVCDALRYYVTNKYYSRTAVDAV